MTKMRSTLSKHEYAALSDDLREAMRLENLHDVLVGTTSRNRVIATSKELRPQQSVNYRPKDNPGSLTVAPEGSAAWTGATVGPSADAEKAAAAIGAVVARQVRMTLREKAIFRRRRIRLIEAKKKALRKLKHPSRSRELRSFLDQ